jgi:hypothetical protein
MYSHQPRSSHILVPLLIDTKRAYMIRPKLEQLSEDLTDRNAYSSNSLIFFCMLALLCSKASSTFVVILAFASNLW